MTLKGVLTQKYAECLSTTCVDKGCKVKLDKLHPDHVILSGTKYQLVFKYTARLCDFLIFVNVSANPISLALVELKGYIDEREFAKVHSQLSNGAVVANQIAASSQVDRFAAYFAKTGMNAFAAKMLVREKYQIAFRGSRCPMKPLHCGDSLPQM
jgi:hypothetical protein